MIDLIADLVKLPNDNTHFGHPVMTLPLHYKIVFQNNDGTIPAQIGSYYFKKATLHSIRKAYEDIQLEIDRHNLLNAVPLLGKTSILHYILCLLILVYYLDLLRSKFDAVQVSKYKKLVSVISSGRRSPGNNAPWTLDPVGSRR